jgi:hypothetical protein
LTAVVAVALLGRGPSSQADARAEGPPAALPAVAAAVVPPSPVLPAASFRSDWPAAIRPRAGIDGPSTHDERAEWSKDAAARGTPPGWIRRLGAMSNYRTDPYER